jgi:hypothetical protein
MSSHSKIDAGIPVLTEIISNPPEMALEVPASTAAPVSQESFVAHEYMPAAAPCNEEQWERLEQEIREAVLLQVLERIDFVMEQRVRDSLADVLQTAVENLASEIKVGLHYAIRDVVTRAVTQEITKLQSGKKQLPPL